MSLPTAGPDCPPSGVGTDDPRWQQGVLNVKTTFLVLATLVATLTVFVPVVAEAQAPRANGGTAVAVIDINYIFKNHQRFKATMEDIKSDIEGFESHLRDERTKITQKAEQLKSLPAGSQQYKILEEGFDPTQFAQEMRLVSGSPVIIPLVASFLW